MKSWKQFSDASPDLARLGEEQLFQHDVGLAFLATVDADGAPRLHPVCPVISGDNCYVFILPKSPKRDDLERNGRFAIQSFPQPKPDSNEFYFTGEAKLISDPEIFSRVYEDAKHPATPDEILFELKINRVMGTSWDGFGTPHYHSVHKKWESK